MDDRLKTIIMHPATVPVVVGTLSFAAGVTAGIFYNRKKLVPVEYDAFEFVVSSEGETFFEETVDPNQTQLEFTPQEWEEAQKPVNMDEVRNYIDSRNHQVTESREPLRLSDLDVKDEEIIVSRSDVKEEEVEDDLTIEEINVFANRGIGGNWDYEAELAKRTDKEPYVLHEDEFHSQEAGYTQTSLTYYEADDILVDERSVPVYNYVTVIGDLEFGHGSTDPNVFFVRNDELGAEYEVLRHSGYFSVEVLGMEIEDQAEAEDLRHSSHRRLRPE